MIRHTLKGWPTPAEERLAVVWSPDGLTARMALWADPNGGLFTLGLVVGIVVRALWLELLNAALLGAPPVFFLSLWVSLFALGARNNLSSSSTTATLTVCGGRIEAATPLWSRSASLTEIESITASDMRLTVELTNGKTWSLHVTDPVSSYDLIWLQLHLQRLVDTARQVRAEEPATRRELDALRNTATVRGSA